MSLYSTFRIGHCCLPSYALGEGQYKTQHSHVVICLPKNGRLSTERAPRLFVPAHAPFMELAPRFFLLCPKKLVLVYWYGICVLWWMETSPVSILVKLSPVAVSSLQPSRLFNLLRPEYIVKGICRKLEEQEWSAREFVPSQRSLETIRHSVQHDVIILWQSVSGCFGSNAAKVFKTPCSGMACFHWCGVLARSTWDLHAIWSTTTTVFSKLRTALSYQSTWILSTFCNWLFWQSTIKVV